MRRSLAFAIAAGFVLATACGTPSPARPTTPAHSVATVQTLRMPSEPATGDATVRAVVITALDVGQGDAILIDFGYSADAANGRCGVEWLVDAGPSVNRIERAFDRIDCELDAFVLTHPHADHFAGAARILEGSPIVQAILGNGEGRGPPRDPTEPSSWSNFREVLERTGGEIVGLREGDVLHPAPDVEVRVLWSGSAAGGHFADTPQGPDINNDSVVLMLDVAGRRALLTGDTESEAQTELLERFCTPAELAGDGPCEGLRADVLKVPHHGSDHVERRFFRAVAPRFALISAGFRNRQFHHPRAEIVEFLLDLGAEVRSTSAEGDEDAWVRIRRDGSIESGGPSEVFAWRHGADTWVEAVLPIRQS